MLSYSRVFGDSPSIEAKPVVAVVISEAGSGVVAAGFVDVVRAGFVVRELVDDFTVGVEVSVTVVEVRESTDVVATEGFESVELDNVCGATLVEPEVDVIDAVVVVVVVVEVAANSSHLHFKMQ